MLPKERNEVKEVIAQARDFLHSIASDWHTDKQNPSQLLLRQNLFMVLRPQHKLTM